MPQKIISEVYQERPSMFTIATILLLFCAASLVSGAKRLPEFAITNYEVKRLDGDVVEFSRFAKGSKTKAYVLEDIEMRRRFPFPVFRAKLVDENEVNRRADAESSGWLPTLPMFHEKVLLYMHGFNVPPRHVLEACGEYSQAHRRLVIPLLWAVEDRSVLGYGADRILNAPTAAEAFGDKLNVVKHVRTSLLCHSMGNYVLRLAARTSETGDRPFEDIFMVAADVSHDIFEKSQNMHADSKENDGLEIRNMVKNKVHVLHSHKDRAMKARKWHPKTWNIPGLGASGYRNTAEHPLHPELVNKLTKFDCSSFSGKADPLIHHRYQFYQKSVDYYEENM